MLKIAEIIQIGDINVVSKINSIENPSIPNLNLINPSIQFLLSTNWNSCDVESNLYHKNNESKKVTNDVNKATCPEFFSIFFAEPLVIKTNTAPIAGRNVIIDKIGKFI